MSKIELYIDKLKSENDWIKFLEEESCLPGPRGNLELLEAISIAGNKDFFNSLLGYDKGIEINNIPEGFLVMCGIAGIGRNLTRDNKKGWEILRQFASHPAWRIRESVAIGLQYYGYSDTEFLLLQMKNWSDGNQLEKRAAIAALCEPGLLKTTQITQSVLTILDKITKSITYFPDHKNQDFIVLKKALGYCWSVAIMKYPEDGKKSFERFLKIEDKNIKWIVKENLKKKRLEKMDKDWVEKCLSQV